MAMQNQAAIEALYSATFAEDYLDTVENLPNDLQRHLSRLREFDLTQYREFLVDLDSHIKNFESESSLSGQRQILGKIMKGLIITQDIGDDKLATVQAISDLVENQTRRLEHDAKNLDFGRDDDDDDDSDSNAVVNVPQAKSKIVSGGGGGAATGKVSSASKNRASGTLHEKEDKSSAKRRKKQNEKNTRSDDEQSTTSTIRSGTKSRGGAANSTHSGSSKKPVAKRKTGGGGKSSRGGNNDKDDSDIEYNIEIDPDEPTYCLCDQVSYGDMIGCDNDLCPIEWFHFNCVQLSSKPKGKWYCPKCRGDKPTVMKPKAQFLKELEKYNKEREEKSMRQNH